MGDGTDRWADDVRDEHDQVVRLTDPDLVPGVAGAGTPYRYRRSRTPVLLWLLRSVVVTVLLVVAGYRGMPTPVLAAVAVTSIIGFAVYESYAYWVVQADRNGILLVGPMRVEAVWWEDVAWSRPYLGSRLQDGPERWVVVRVDRERIALPPGFRGSELDRWRFELGGAPPRDHVPPSAHPPAPPR